MISVENLSKSFGRQLLFEGVSFKINRRERVGLVGRNGQGKTTLFRIIVGEESADSGAVVIPRGYRIAYVRQNLEFTEGTVLLEGMKALPDAERGQYWRVEKVLSGLGFCREDMQRHPREFSGGYQVRLNLVKALVSDPDLLLLDEPTNYLDITSIRWVERFLKEWRHELLLITHDRSLMDSLVTHTVGIHRRRIRKVEGDTEKYYAQIAQEEEIYEKTRMNDEQRRKEVEVFISRFRAKARLANLVQSRVKALEKMDKKDRLETMKTLDFSFRENPYKGKYLLGVDAISFSYDPENPLINDLSITVGAHDRICVIGRNGKGKTTLLRLLAGALAPQKGKIMPSPGVAPGYFEQTNIQRLVDSRTVEEEILASDPAVDRQVARNICGAMLFEGDLALKKIEVLSGGEKSRVMLGKLLASPSNLLLLDEPTNHLDMESADALLAALDSFGGAVVLVTHNEMFLHALANRLIVFDRGGVFLYEGTYQRFLEKEGWKEEEETSEGGSSAKEQVKGGLKQRKKELRRIRSQIISERSVALTPLKIRMEHLETDIEELERALQRLNSTMEEAVRNQEGRRIGEVSQAMHRCQEKIDMLFDELAAVSASFEEQEGIFAAKLSEFASGE
jgi:ATP-binding cassette, subfamily F, member 3